MQFNKKGQIAQTGTWIVATIVIVFLTMLFLLLVARCDDFEIVGVGCSPSIESVEAKVSEAFVRQTLFAILESGEEGNKIRNQIQSGNIEDIKLNVESKLEELESGGYFCSFVVAQEGIVVDRTGGKDKGILAGVEIDGREVRLKC